MGFPRELRVMPNPYDFRNPAGVADRPVIGRQNEELEIQRHLKSTAAGTPVNIAFVGERNAGKTSLLNRTSELARDERLLPVRIDLDEGIALDQFTFFRALFETAVRKLAEEKCIQDMELIAAWRRALYFGEVDLGDPPLLQFSVIGAAVARGLRCGDITPAVLREDFLTIAMIAKSAGWRGVCLLVDEGDLLTACAAAMQKLRNLLQGVVHWTMVIAGTPTMFEKIKDIFSPIPRQFVHIAVGPYETVAGVTECITGPIEDSRRLLVQARLLPDYRAINDIAVITHRLPYEINLVCYHIWEKLRSDTLESFEPSVEVLDAVLDELHSFGQTYASEGEIHLVRALSSDDLETMVDIMPFLGYSPQEIALARLWPAKFNENELADKETDAKQCIEYLESKGLLRLEISGRVSSQLSPAGSVYFRYKAGVHARLHSSHHGTTGEVYDSYATFIASSIVKPLRDEATLGLIPADVRVKELGDPAVGRWLERAEYGLQNNDILALNDAGPLMLFAIAWPWRDSSEGLPFADDQQVAFVGLVIAVELERVEYGAVFWTKQFATAEERICSAGPGRVYGRGTTRGGIHGVPLNSWTRTSNVCSPCFRAVCR